MRAGRLRERVTFQAETRTGDGGGGAAVSWGNVVTVWGEYTPESPREAVAGGRIEAAEAGVLTVRSSTETRAITSAHRVLIGGTPFALKGGPTNFDQRNRSLDFKVEKGVAT